MTRTSLRLGNWVLGAAFAVLLVNAGTRFSIGLLLPEMEQDLQWSRTTISTAVLVFMAITALALPFLGRLSDRFGGLTVLGVGVFVSTLTIGAMAWVQTPAQTLIVYGVGFGLGAAACSITPVGVLLSHHFPERMGMANSIAISGMGIGQLVVLLVLSAHVADLGWRHSYLALCLLTAITLVPVLWVALRLGEARIRAATSDNRDGAVSGELKRALRDKRLWWLFAIYAICGLQDFFVATHIVALALDHGVNNVVAGNALAFMGLAGLIGVLLTGVVNDRLGPVFPTVLCFVLRIALFGALLVAPLPLVIVGAAFVYGLTFWTTAPLTVVFARRLGYPALLGTLTGLITMCHHLAGGIGAFVGAQSYDLEGSYTPALFGVLVLAICGLAMTLMMRSLDGDKS